MFHLKNDFKLAFLDELVHACLQNSLPTLIGDFNTLRSRKENNGNLIAIGLFSSLLDRYTYLS